MTHHHLLAKVVNPWKLGEKRCFSGGWGEVKADVDWAERMRLVHPRDVLCSKRGDFCHCGVDDTLDSLLKIRAFHNFFYNVCHQSKYYIFDVSLMLMFIICLNTNPWVVGAHQVYQQVVIIHYCDSGIETIAEYCAFWFSRMWYLTHWWNVCTRNSGATSCWVRVTLKQSSN